MESDLSTPQLPHVGRCGDLKSFNVFRSSFQTSPYVEKLLHPAWNVRFRWLAPFHIEWGQTLTLFSNGSMWMFEFGVNSIMCYIIWMSALIGAECTFRNLKRVVTAELKLFFVIFKAWWCIEMDSLKVRSHVSRSIFDLLVWFVCFRPDYSLRSVTVLC